MTRYAYPPAPRQDVVDDFHGTPVADPYRRLEEPDAPESVAWAAAQNALARDFLDEIPGRETTAARLTALWDYPKVTPPVRRGAFRFFTRNDGLQNQAVLYRQRDGEEPEALLDPNQLSDDATMALISFFPDDEGRRTAYSLSESGSDWQVIRVRETESGGELPDEIRWVKFTPAAWLPDGSGFFYARYPEPGSMPEAAPSTHQRLYRHRLGDAQSADALVYARPDFPELGFYPQVTEDGDFLTLTAWHGTDVENRFYYARLGADGEVQGIVRLLDEGDAHYEFAGNVGTCFYFLTDLDAPLGRVIAIDIEQPEREQWQEIVPEGEDTLDLVRMVNGRLVLLSLHNACHRLTLCGLDGAPAGEIALPGMGTVTMMTGRQADTALHYDFQAHFLPPNVYRYDFAAGKSEPVFAVAVDFDAGAYLTEQRWYPSRDGTRIPIFLTGRRDLPRNGDTPTLLYGYGGFAVNRTPLFSPFWLAWLEAGGLLAEPNLRGGNEFGEAWHAAGMLEKKQNVFDDFIAAAEWLIGEGYTRTSRLGIMGRSNGGLLVAACMVQRPELFGAVICGVPVIDMLRYHLFTAGRYWVGEYGNAVENAEHFRFLYAYSPLHNVRPGVDYPPTLILTADTDDRVVPMHAKKFAAALQHVDSGANPLLLRVESRAGHGLGKPTDKQIAENLDVLLFLKRTLMM